MTVHASSHQVPGATHGRTLDAVLVARDDGIFAVADTVGTIPADAALPAADALVAFRQALASTHLPWDEAAVASAMRSAHDALCCDTPRGRPTTMTVLVFADAHCAIVGHAGDSVAFRVRDGHIERLTACENVAGVLAARGTISPEEARHHPGRKELLNGVGIPALPRLQAKMIDARPGDLFLLATDGLSDGLSDDEIGAFCTARGQHWTAADGERLVAEATARAGADDCSLVSVWLPPGEDPRPRPAAPEGRG